MNTSILMRSLLVAASALFVGSQTHVFANEKNVAVYSETKPAATIKYLGVQDEYFLFQVDLKQPKEQRASLRISDGNGTEIYRTTIFEKDFSRKIKIPREGFKNLQFVFDAQGQLLTKTYSINTEVIEKVAVEEVASL